jgi:hypothetical protein
MDQVFQRKPTLLAQCTAVITKTSTIRTNLSTYMKKCASELNSYAFNQTILELRLTHITAIYVMLKENNVLDVNNLTVKLCDLSKELCDSIDIIAIGAGFTN